MSPTQLDLSCSRYSQVEGTITLASTGSLPVTWTATPTRDEYHWDHSGMVGGPAFDWIDIRYSGTAIAIYGDDANTGPFPIGFDFPFFDNAFGSFRLCSNGWISFSSMSTSFTPQRLPSPGAPENLIAAWWADLYIDGDSSVHYLHASPDRLIIQYTDIAYLGNPSFRSSFQICLHQDGTILLNYLRLDSPNNGMVGIQNANCTNGLTITSFAPLLAPGMVVRIQPIPNWLTLAPPTGSLASGSSQPLRVIAEPAGRSSGIYRSSVVIQSDDNDTPAQRTDVVLTVVNPHAPIASSGTLAVTRNTPASLLLGGTDEDGDPLSFASVIPPRHGTLSGSPPNLTYVPDQGYVGADAFVFSASDGERTSPPAMILIDVQHSHIGPPIGQPASLVTNEDLAASIALTANDPDGDPISWIITAPPSHGTTELRNDSLIYTPAADWNGTDSVQAAPSDGSSFGSSITIQVTVTPVNDSPSLMDGDLAAISGVPAEWIPIWSDVDGDPVVLQIAGPPGHGTATVAGQNLRFTSDPGWTGTDTVLVQACDPGGLLSPVATVTIHVSAAPSPPSQAAPSAGGAGGCGAGLLGLLAFAGLGLRRRRRVQAV